MERSYNFFPVLVTPITGRKFHPYADGEPLFFSSLHIFSIKINLTAADEIFAEARIKKKSSPRTPSQLKNRVKHKAETRVQDK